MTSKEKELLAKGELSDGYHTFNDLYYQRCMLFATIVNTYSKLAWKSHRHENGELCFGGGWFIVGIDTPDGSYTYHYENKYWDLFDCEELEYSKHWDGHTDKDVTRLLSLIDKYLEALDILKEEVLLDFVNYLNKSLKGNIDETVNIMWISSQLTNYLRENNLII